MCDFRLIDRDLVEADDRCAMIGQVSILISCFRCFSLGHFYWTMEESCGKTQLKLNFVFM